LIFARLFTILPHYPTYADGVEPMTSRELTQIIAALAILLIASGCSVRQASLRPTGSAISAPAVSEPDFSRYVSESHDKIRRVLDAVSINGGSGFLGGYSNEEAAAMRAPFQIPETDADLCSDRAKGGGKGFLLIHGLTDSPYLMRSVAESLHKAYPCGVVRAILLPGHGTVPGDTLSMKYEEWIQTTAYGVRSFEKDAKISKLYLVGFSTGAALALRHVKDSGNAGKVQGLVLLSPALKAKSPLAWLAGSAELFSDWQSIYPERDAARYESFSYHAAAEFYELTRGLSDGGYTLDIPLLMAVSGDDSTIDALAARRFFCDSPVTGRRALIWYRSGYTEDSTAALCSDILTVETEGTGRRYNGTPYRLANISHTAVPVSPADRHYGVNGRYRNCKSYDGNGNPDDFANCQTGSPKTIFGESSIGTSHEKEVLGYDYWRRGTFNPDYDRLEKSITCFVDRSCKMESLPR